MPSLGVLCVLCGYSISQFEFNQIFPGGAAPRAAISLRAGAITLARVALMFPGRELTFPRPDMSYRRVSLTYPRPNMSYRRVSLTYPRTDMTLLRRQLTYPRGELTYGRGGMAFRGRPPSCPPLVKPEFRS